MAKKNKTNNGRSSGPANAGNNKIDIPVPAGSESSEPKVLTGVLMLTGGPQVDPLEDQDAPEGAYSSQIPPEFIEMLVTYKLVDLVRLLRSSDTEENLFDNMWKAVERLVSNCRKKTIESATQQTAYEGAAEVGLSFLTERFGNEVTDKLDEIIDRVNVCTEVEKFTAEDRQLLNLVWSPGKVMWYVTRIWDAGIGYPFKLGPYKRKYEQIQVVRKALGAKSLRDKGLEKMRAGLVERKTALESRVPPTGQSSAEIAAAWAEKLDEMEAASSGEGETPNANAANTSTRSRKTGSKKKGVTPESKTPKATTRKTTTKKKGGTPDSEAADKKTTRTRRKTPKGSTPADTTASAETQAPATADAEATA